MLKNVLIVSLILFCSVFASILAFDDLTAQNIDSKQKILALVNSERAAAGLPPFEINPVLDRIADIRSKELLESFSHIRPDGRSFESIFYDFNTRYSSCGENIAKGYRSAEDVMAGWMNSPGHRKNILNPKFKYIGVGEISDNSNCLHWVQVFSGDISGDISGFKNEILSLVNSERKKAGISPLIMDPALYRFAGQRTAEIVRCYSHNRPDGRSFSSIFKDNDIRYFLYGENIAKGQVDPKAVMRDWMNSPGHRKNILNPEFKYIGIGVIPDNSNCLHWVQLFAGERFS